MHRVHIPIYLSAKDLYEDIKRKRQDSDENNAQTNVVSSVSDRKVNWSDLHVGTLIKVEKNEFFPCDVLIVNTSEPKGVCYIETKNLDGETNLK
jgi:phospholipid-transporting ATPase